jgi:hypothetical protein
LLYFGCEVISLSLAINAWNSASFLILLAP